jgi:hypothetical protein
VLVLLASAMSLLPGDARALAPDTRRPPSGPTARSEPVPEGSAGSPAGRPIAPIRNRPEPAVAPVVVCSFVLPLCVHAARAIHPAFLLETLQSAEQAMRAFDAIGLGRPLADGMLGGSSAYDIYLIPGAEPPATHVAELHPGAPFDQAAPFAVLAPPPRPGGCDASARVAHALAHASLLRLDAAAAPGTLAMTATYLASLVTGCDLVDLAAIDDFQRAPERQITAGALGRPDGAMLFPWFLDDTYGTGHPAAVILGLFAVTPQRTPAGSWHFTDEPDLFDALRANLKDRGGTLDALLLDFAVARAFFGSRSDGAHLSDAGRFGHFGRVRFDWSIPYASLPRRLAQLHPIEPTGATYLWLDLEGAPKHAEVTFVAEWELGSVFFWALVKVDKTGSETGRIETGGVYGSTRAERTLVGLDGLAGLLIAGVNVGSLDRSEPFDPDEPTRPSGYAVTLAK